MRDLPHCITSPMASMHNHVICMLVKQRKIRENPNLIMLRTNKHLNRETETQKT